MENTNGRRLSGIHLKLHEEEFDKEEEDRYDYLLEWFSKNPGVYYFRQLEVLHEDQKRLRGVINE